jgi:hypothetical protein
MWPGSPAKCNRWIGWNWPKRCIAGSQTEGRVIDVLVQVKTSSEPSKYGLPPEQLPAFLDTLRGYDTLRVRGTDDIGDPFLGIRRGAPLFSPVAGTARAGPLHKAMIWNDFRWV